MKKYFIAICVLLLMAGCATKPGSRNIVSPSMSEDEAIRHVRTLPAIGTLSASEQEPVKEREVQQEKNTPPDKPLFESRYAQKALILLLEKKGIITAEELNEEIKRLKAE